MEKNWETYGGFHGYGTKALAKVVAKRYRQKSYKGKKLFSKVRVNKRKMPYGETRYFLYAKFKK